MAITEGGTILSYIAGATFSSGDLYKGVYVNSSGHAAIVSGTGQIPVGVLYGQTATTSAAGVQAVPVHDLNGLFKVNMAGSTLAAGDSIAFSTAGRGIAPTTNAARVGVIRTGSSGSTGRIVTVAGGVGVQVT